MSGQEVANEIKYPISANLRVFDHCNQRKFPTTVKRSPAITLLDYQDTSFALAYVAESPSSASFKLFLYSKCKDIPGLITVSAKLSILGHNVLMEEEGCGKNFAITFEIAEKQNFIEENSKNLGKMEFRLDAQLTFYSTASKQDIKCKYDFSDLGLGLWSREDKDITFLVQAEEKIPAHKCIIRNASKVFDRMFDHTSMKEAQSSQIDLRGTTFSSNVIRLAIKACYELDTIATLTDALELLHFFDCYQIFEKKDCLEYKLTKHIKVETVADIANAAMTANAQKLKIACFQFLEKCVNKHSVSLDYNKLDACFKNELIIHLFSHKDECFDGEEV